MSTGLRGVVREEASPQSSQNAASTACAYGEATEQSVNAVFSRSPASREFVAPARHVAEKRAVGAQRVARLQQNARHDISRRVEKAAVAYVRLARIRLQSLQRRCPSAFRHGRVPESMRVRPPEGHGRVARRLWLAKRCLMLRLFR